VAGIEAAGGRALAVRCDVSKDDDLEALAVRTAEAFGPADILVNNAGVMLRGPIEAMPLSEWEWIMGINFFGAVRGVNTFAPAMLARGSGHVVNVASVGGLMGGRPHSAAYSASKFALVGYSETLYVAMKSKGIGVSVLCPGGVRTALPDAIRLSAAAREGEDYGLGEAFGPEAAEPEAIAALVLDAVETGRFLILSHPIQQKLLERRVSDMQAWVENRAKAG
jgi:NAD(P)-dependent dehydrogenase (short-subunit alcohol dehydrogenase family)